MVTATESKIPRGREILLISTTTSGSTNDTRVSRNGTPGKISLSDIDEDNKGVHKGNDWRLTNQGNVAWDSLLIKSQKYQKLHPKSPSDRRDLPGIFKVNGIFYAVPLV